jgi:hypothetical protein
MSLEVSWNGRTGWRSVIGSNELTSEIVGRHVRAEQWNRDVPEHIEDPHPEALQ